jgi:hypothetical protein
MSTSTDDDLRAKLIRERARRVWEQMGRPAGKDLDFWLIAEKEINYEHPRSWAEVATKPAA